jgi:hypothetical protein
MVGAAKVTVSFSTSNSTGLELNGRLYDVFPDGQAVLVDRGPRRVTPVEAQAGSVTYWLHANGWRFPAGHSVRIEIAQDDSPYLTASSAPSTTDISEVKLAIPIREGDDSGGGGPTPPLAGPCANRLDGTQKADDFSASPAGDLVHARRGADRVHVLTGRDCLFGQRGPDRLFGDEGQDLVVGGRGRDRVNGGPGRDRLKSGTGSDVIRAQDGERDLVRCGRGDDFAQVDPKLDRVRGCELLATASPGSPAGRR